MSHSFSRFVRTPASPALLLLLALAAACSPTTVNPGQAGIWFRPYQKSQSAAVVGEGRYWLTPAYLQLRALEGSEALATLAFGDL